MTFRGWPVEAIEFFEGLEADNSKTYWQRNKEVYDSMVRAPMEELLAEIEPEFGEGRIFRPYRDIRFSADKSPVQDEHRRDDPRRLRPAHRRRPGRRIRHVGDGTRSARALPGGRERHPVRRHARQGGARGTGCRGGGLRPRRLEDGPEGLSQGSSADRAPPVQGHHHVAGVAGRRVAGEPRRPRIASWRCSGRRSRSTSGFEPTSAPRPCPSDGDRLDVRRHHRGREDV